ncbi:hypothetical protein Q7P35_001873 [Cladosporium inversicolor]
MPRTERGFTLKNKKVVQQDLLPSDEYAAEHKIATVVTDKESFNDARKALAIANAAVKSDPLQPNLKTSFTICVQHKLGPHLASSGRKILLADYVAIELSTPVYKYLHAIKYDSLKKPSKPEVLDQVFTKDVKKAMSCGILGYSVQSGDKSVSLEEGGFVTWEDVVLAVYMLPAESYEVADPMWDSNDERCYSWVDTQL